jgi:hypothetical protein
LTAWNLAGAPARILAQSPLKFPLPRNSEVDNVHEKLQKKLEEYIPKEFARLYSIRGLQDSLLQ